MPKDFKVGMLFPAGGFNVYRNYYKQVWVARPSMGCFGKRLLGYLEVVDGAVTFREPKGQPVGKVDRAEILSLLSEGAFDSLLEP